MVEPSEQNPYSSPSVSGTGSDDDSATPVNEKLIVLATFDNAIKAHMFRNELAENGIDAKIANETSTANFGATIGGASSAFWVEVLVLESEAERGLEIKNKWNAPKEPEEDVIPEWTCGCGETVDAGFGVCWSCEAEYPA